MTFAKRLQTAMQVCGMKASVLARRTGLSKADISHLTHKRQNPSRETLAKLLNAMQGVDARWLVCGDIPVMSQPTIIGFDRGSPDGDYTVKAFCNQFGILHIQEIRHDNH